MTKIYYSDITKLKLKDISLDKISSKRIIKANNYSNESKKKECLASYLLLTYAFKQENIEIKDFKMLYTKFNKPYFDNQYHFNITHSHNLIGVAISDIEVGLDIEYQDSEKNISKLIKKVFNNELVDKNSFYLLWTKREAYYKSLGIGYNKDFFTEEVPEIFSQEVFDDEGNSYYLSCTELKNTLLKIKYQDII